ncbi:uncharacterized protein ACIB01_006071 [Guaruba guarouba]
MAGWRRSGGKGRERIHRLRFKGERKGPGRWTEKERRGAIPSCPERKPGCGGRAIPTTPFSPGMKEEGIMGGGVGVLGGESRPTPVSPEAPAPYHGVGGTRRAAERGAAVGGCSLGCWARRGLRRQEGKQRGREPGGNAATSRPEEEAVAMVGALRGNAPGPSSSSSPPPSSSSSSSPLRSPPAATSTRVSARTRCGFRNPRTHTQPPTKAWPGGGALPNHRGSRRLIDGGQAPAGQSRRRFVRGFFQYLLWCDLSQALLIGSARPPSLLLQQQRQEALCGSSRRH